MEVTLNLPENIYRNFSELAEKNHRHVENIIAHKWQDDLSVDAMDYEKTVGGWSDEAVSAFANLKIPKEQIDRIIVLLEHLDEGAITDSEEIELEVYTQLSQTATLRNAYGIAEAVKRKLISSPADLK